MVAPFFFIHVSVGGLQDGRYAFAGFGYPMLPQGDIQSLDRKFTAYLTADPVEFLFFYMLPDDDELVADFFIKMGRKLYYFHKDSGLEIDFVIRYRGQATLIEAKATTGDMKSTKTILKHPEKYHIHQAIKLGNYNIGHTQDILTLPMYIGFLLDEA